MPSLQEGVRLDTRYKHSCNTQAVTLVANSNATDGGGIRGLVSLLILQRILEFIRDEERECDRKLVEAGHRPPRADERDKEVPLACHYVSFMFGTSTGG